MIVSLFLFIKSGDTPDTKPSDLGILLMRAILGSIGLFSNFYALDHLLLSDASILNKLAPFFTLILSAIFLKEKTNWKQFLFVVLAFVGMLFADIRSGVPGLIPIVVALISAAIMGICGILIKKCNVKWLEQYALPISMLGAMAASIPVTMLMG